MALQPSTHNPQLEEAGGSGRVFNVSRSHSDGTKVAKRTMTVYHSTTVMVSRGLNNSGYIINSGWFALHTAEITDKNIAQYYVVLR